MTASADGDRSASLVRGWVRLYTRGLPREAAAQRLALIEADLWDEANAGWPDTTSGLAHQRLSRLMRGVPADVAWRVEQQRRITHLPRRADMRISMGQAVALALVAIWQVFMIVVLSISENFRAWSWMGLTVVGLGLAVGGVALAVTRPQAGFLVGVAGILIAFLMMPWLLPFFLPLPIALGYRLAREPMPDQTTATGS